MSLLNQLLRDESGSILSAEAVILGTVGVAGAGVGLSAIGKSMQAETQEVAYALRSLDQSYSFDGQQSEHAWSAGSRYVQPPVEKSHRELRKWIEREERKEKQEQKRRPRAAQGPDLDSDLEPVSEL
jgi:hypothetical protein